MAFILQVFYSVFSGATLALAIPNELLKLGSPVLTFVALIPFYLALSSCKNFKQAVADTFIQILTVHLISSFWLIYFQDYAWFTYGGSAFGVCLIGCAYGLLYFLPLSRTKANPLTKYSLSKKFYEYSSFRVFFFAAIYTTYEWTKSSGFLGYPWGTVSSAMFRFSTFRQLAAITGTYGITFLTALFNALVAEGFILISDVHKNVSKSQPKITYYRDYLRSAAVFAIFFISSLIYGNYEICKVRTPVKKLTAVMVQQNSNPWNTNADLQSIIQSEALTDKAVEELAKDGKTPQLVVWSEGTLTKPFPNSLYFYKNNPEGRSLTEFIKQTGAPLIAGGAYTTVDENKFREYFNAAHVFDKDGNYRGYYGKLHLVPFAESIPGIQNPKIKAIIQKIVGISAGWSKGKQLTYFDIPCSWYDKQFTEPIYDYDVSVPYEAFKSTKDDAKVRICIPICFDDSFTDVIRPLYMNGAELFINITDDSWSLKDSSEFQHFVIASYRAIEYRTTFVRSTNAGYSVVLDPAGKIIADQPLFQESSIGFDIPVYRRHMTIYAIFGNWFAYACILFLCGTAVTFFLCFEQDDYIPSERKIKKSHKGKKSEKARNKDKKDSGSKKKAGLKNKGKSKSKDKSKSKKSKHDKK